MTLKQVRPLLAFQNRRLALVYLGVACLNACCEVLVVAAMYPLVASVSLAGTAIQSGWLKELHQLTGAASSQGSLFALGGLFLLLFLVATLLNGATYWLHLRWTLSLRHALAVHLLRVYLHRSYAWFTSRHTSDLVKDVLDEMDRLVYECIAKLSTLFYRGLTACLIVVGLVLVDPLVAAISAALLCVAYQSIYAVFRARLKRLGQRRIELNQQRHRLVQESLSAIKEGRLVRRRAVLHQGFERVSRDYLALESQHRLIGEIPRHLTEGLAVLAIMLVFFFLSQRMADPRLAFGSIGVYVMAVWRLVPALQEIYACLVDLRYSLPVLEAFQPVWSELPAALDGPPSLSRPFNKTIELRDVTFSYAETDSPALREINLEVPKSSLVALVGRTGSGKTTAADLLGGLLWPSKGALLIDGRPLGANDEAAWQACIGYVPQTIYLSDQSIAQNIALGYPENEIDPAQVQRVARVAQIDERIERLPRAYQTTVGERGLSLSGGERQRIGIARALYPKPEVLILDEATSALDHATEESFMAAVRALEGSHTVVLIAHRISTVRDCSRIYVFDEGLIVSHGSYAELLANCPRFQELAGV
ncbi:ABC transporter ATP-binding protein [bacterium]|nr:ABC transporter ATP-binding protein [bacterium]